MGILKKAFAIYFAVILLSIITYSCCEETYYRIIGSGYISAFDLETGNSFSEDSIGAITGAFNISVQHQIETVASTFDLNFIQAAYATSCPEIFENQLVENTLRITSDRDFSYENTVIESGTNLTSIGNVRYEVSAGSIFVDFDDDFTIKANFEDEVYSFKTEILTTDSLLLENAIQLKFDLE